MLSKPIFYSLVFALVLLVPVRNYSFQYVRYNAHYASEKANETYSRLSSIGHCIGGEF